MGKPKTKPIEKAIEKPTSLNHENTLCESKDSNNLVQDEKNEQNITLSNNPSNQITTEESSNITTESPNSKKENVGELSLQNKTDSTRSKIHNENKIIEEVFFSSNILIVFRPIRSEGLLPLPSYVCVLLVIFILICILEQGAKIAM